MTKSLTRGAIGAVVILAASMLYMTSPASADHFVAGTKTCTSVGNSIEFNCTFTVERGPDAFDVVVGDEIHVHLTGNAAYTDVAVAPGGTCDVALTAQTDDHLTLVVGLGGCPPGSSFTLIEQLEATGSGGGQVCQSPDEHGEHSPVLTHCAANFQVPAVVGPPTSKEQCKNGGWQAFNNPVFKNQGDCVSFVATGGRNEAAG